jgi:spore photoproduct lyase
MHEPSVSLTHPRRLPLLGNGRPAPIERTQWIQHFPGGEGRNNCPRFFYIRDGFGCIFTCEYCYLRRLEFRHQRGAEFNPNFDGLYEEVRRFLQRPGELGLILGEVTDAWGWAHMLEIRERNLRLIEMFRVQDRHTLIFLTKSGRVHQHIRGIVPSNSIVFSWSVNAPAVAEIYEMGARQTEDRLFDALALREAGWRTRLRVDPMIPIPGWREHYAQLAEDIAEIVRPEQATVGSWRPRRQDEMYRKAPPELRALMELGPDRRLRIKNRVEMYELVWSALHGRVPELSLCKEEVDIEAALYTKFNVYKQACNCLGSPKEPVGLISLRALLRAKGPHVPA